MQNKKEAMSTKSQLKGWSENWLVIRLQGVYGHHLVQIPQFYKEETETQKGRMMFLKSLGKHQSSRP